MRQHSNLRATSNKQVKDQKIWKTPTVRECSERNTMKLKWTPMSENPHPQLMNHPPAFHRKGSSVKVRRKGA